MKGSLKYTEKPFFLLGGLEGVRALVDSFYDIMATTPEARKIRDMHPKDLLQTRENLTLFLSGWLGGPSLYIKKFGSVNLTEIHALMKIDIAERDIWLSCMEQALKQQAIDKDFRAYLLQRFRIPAEKIRATCQEKLREIPLS